MIDWHRLFGVLMIDLFVDSPFVVELERELSKHQQFLDLLVIRRLAGEFSGRLPDGLDNLADHNLVTYKSLREALDDWALKELTGHYVNYRKEVSASRKRLLDESAFQLYAVATRFPTKLSKQLSFERIVDGVYEVRRGTDRIRIIVLDEISEEPHNSIWQLFSAQEQLVKQGATNYRFRRAPRNSVVNALFETYRREGLLMGYSIEQFEKDYVKHHLHLLEAQERLEGLAPKERLEGLAPKERLEGLAPKERLEGLAPKERLEGLAPKELLKGLSDEEQDRLLQLLLERQRKSAAKPKSKKK